MKGVGTTPWQGFELDFPKLALSLLIICHCVPEGEVLIQKTFKHLCNFKHIIQVCNTSPLHQAQLVPVSSAGSDQAHKWHQSVVPCGRPPWMEMQLSVLCLICQYSTSLLHVVFQGLLQPPSRPEEKLGGQKATVVVDQTFCSEGMTQEHKDHGP